jgi:hypothetical protein
MIILASAISSCESTKHFDTSYDNEIKKGRDNTSDVFIIKKDGEKIEGKTITFSLYSKWREVQKENWIAVDGQKVELKDIAKYQSPNGYYAFYKYDPHIEGEQYIFIPRIRGGKISIYYSSATTVISSAQSPGIDHNVYYFEKASGRLTLFTFPEFRQAIKDNPKALEKLNEVFPNGKIPYNDHLKNLQKLAEVADVYNS